MRKRVAESHIGDFELTAARVVARLTGERVVVQDDNSDRGMVDIRIDYRGRPPGYVEVVMDIDPGYSAMASFVRGQRAVPVPDLGRVWFVTVSPRARIQRLIRDLPAKLRLLQQAEALFEYVTGQQQLEKHQSRQVRDLAALGIVQLASRPARDGEEGRVLLFGQGTGGAAEQDWTAFHGWLRDYLHDENRADVRRKLRATNADERHVFVGMSFSTPWLAYHALSEDYNGLPERPPELPGEITHLWVYAYPTGRCLAWFPDKGWVDPRACWATE
ncbi:hypothetical protein JNW89_25705 [Micromonospora sp. 4G55]|nr:hypothetical protein [Micromonospora sp. 4G55]